MIKEMYEKETKILEAICNDCCRNVLAISNVTEINYAQVKEILSEANLLVELKRMRECEDYEKIKSCYRRGMILEELEEKTKLKYTRLVEPLKRVKRELGIEEGKLVNILNQITLKRLEAADEEGVLSYYAYRYSHKYWAHMSFKKAYRRIKDMYEGYTATECARRWNVTGQAALQFIDKIGMRERRRKKFKKAAEDDILLYYAYLHSHKPYARISFEEAHRRAKDIYDGCSVSECARRWNMTSGATSNFIDRIGMRRIYRRERVYKENLEKDQKEKLLSVYAYLPSHKPRTSTDYKKWYQRIKDIVDGYSVSECVKRWNITKKAVLRIMRKTGMRKKRGEGV